MIPTDTISYQMTELNSAERSLSNGDSSTNKSTSKKPFHGWVGLPHHDLSERIYKDNSISIKDENEEDLPKHKRINKK